MYMFLAKIGFKTLLEKFLKQALLYAIEEIFSHREELKQALNNEIDKLSDKTKEKLVEEVNKK